MSEIRFDTISHSWLAWDTENDQPLNPQPIIEVFTPHDIYYDARVPFGAVYEATQSDTIHITADLTESLTLTLAAPDVFVAFERNVRAVSVTTEVENGDDVLLVNLQNGALIRLVQSGADTVRFRIGSNSDDRQGYDGTSQTLAGFAASYQTGFGRDSAVFDPNIGQADILFGANGQLKPVLIGLPVSATDPNGDPIVYRLDNVSLALGFDIDAQSGQVIYRGDGSTLVDGDRLTLTITASSHGANGDNSEIQQALTVNVVTGVQTENEIRWYNGGWAVWDIVNDQPLTPQPDELWDVNNLIVITADVTDTLMTGGGGVDVFFIDDTLTNDLEITKHSTADSTHLNVVRFGSPANVTSMELADVSAFSSRQTNLLVTFEGGAQLVVTNANDFDYQIVNDDTRYRLDDFVARFGDGFQPDGPVFQSIGNYIIFEDADGTQAPVLIGAPIQAIDEDGDVVTYSLSPSTADGFVIDANSGQLSYIGSNADLRAMNNLQAITVLASSLGADGRTQETISYTITLTIAEVGEPPILTNLGVADGRLSVDVYEGEVDIIMLSAIDLDNDPLFPGKGLTWSLVDDPDSDNDLFALGGNGLLRWHTRPDFDAPNQRTSFTVRAQVTDNVFTEEMTITVNLLNANDIAPIISPPEGLALSEQQGVYAAGTVLANGNPFTAVNVLGTPRWSIDIGGFDDGLFFDIDAETGVLSVHSDLAVDFEAKSRYALVVRLTTLHPSGEQTATFDVTIEVEDSNDAPVLSAEGVGTVDENDAAARVAGVVLRVSDEDATAAPDVSWFSLTGAYADAFEVVDGSNSGEFALKLKDGVSLDAETDDSTITLTVQLDDQNSAQNLSNALDVTLHLVDLNDVTPVFSSGDTGLNLTPATSYGAQDVVYAAVATGDDVAAVIYSLAESATPTGDYALFEIDAATGIVSFTRDTMPDFAAKPSYQFDVVATTGRLEARQTVTIAVIDTAEQAPEITSGARAIDVTENVEINDRKTVYVAEATHVNTISWTLAGRHADLFAIDAATGDVTFAEPTTANFEVIDSYHFTIIANAETSSGHTVSRGRAITLSVGDANDPLEVRFSGVASLAENPLVLTSTGLTFTLSDEDASSRAEVTVYEEETVSQRFAVTEDDGVYSLVARAKADIDYETEPLIDLRLVVDDGENPATTHAVQVEVVNVLDVRPGILPPPRRLSFAEGTSFKRSDILYTAEAKIDIGASPRWSLLDPHAPYFTIDGAGNIRFALDTTFDHEMIGIYTLKIRLETDTANGGTAYDTQTLEIIVTDLNDPPELGVFGVGRLAENQAEGTRTGLHFTVTDADDRQTPDVSWFEIYTDAAATTREDRFEVVLTQQGYYDLMVKAGHPFDADVANPEINIYLRLNDGVAQTELHRLAIAIGDRTDEPTQITSGTSGIRSLTDGVTYGPTTVVYMASGLPDEATADDIVWSLADDDGGSGDYQYFTIAPNVGVVLVSTSLTPDLARNPTFTFKVVAHVNGRADGLDVQVRVVDADDIPTIATSGTAMVAEDAVAGTPTGLLLLPDSPVSGEAFTPTLAQFQVLAGTRGSAISDLFEVIHNGSDYVLAVRAGALFDFEDRAQLDVRVVVSDDLGAQSTPLAVQVLQVVYDVFGTDAAETIDQRASIVGVTIESGDGDDTILDSPHDDIIEAGRGDDIIDLRGGGADAVRFGVASGGRAIDGGDYVIGFQLQNDRVVFVHTPSATDTNTDNAPQTLSDFLMSAAGFDGMTGTADDWFVASPNIDQANGETVVTGIRFKFVDTSPSALESKLAASIISIGFDAPLALDDFISMIGGVQNFDTATLSIIDLSPLVEPGGLFGPDGLDYDAAIVPPI